MKLKTIAKFLAVTALTVGFGSAKDSPDEQRAKIRKMAAESLTELYKLHPDAQQAIKKSAGYAVFSDLGMHLLLVSSAHGAGLAVNSKTGHETFMKMFSGGVGLGVGVKNFRIIFVFETEAALTKFVDSGWDASGQADAAAKTSKSGGAYSGATNASEGVWVYQITKAGLALQATLQGTKYSKDDKLNKT
jgi:lipid-binding SYLF domain-containing protein